jgi:hypothetical protein
MIAFTFDNAHMKEGSQFIDNEPPQEKMDFDLLSFLQDHEDLYLLACITKNIDPFVEERKSK